MSITVKRPEPHNIHALKRIWQTCFGDSDEYIDLFFDKGFQLEYGLVALYDYKPVGMLYTLPTVLNMNGKEYLGEYIYAVGVNPEFRNKGIMRAMEQEAFSLAKSVGLSFITLIPQTPDLYKMYEKLGYKTSFYSSIRSYMPFKVPQVDGISVRQCSKEEFKQLREAYLSNLKMYVDFLPPFDDYRFTEFKAVGTDTMLCVVDGEKYYFNGFKRGSIYLIRETSLPDELLRRALPLIAHTYSAEVISIKGHKTGVVDSITPYAMYKSVDGEIDANMVKTKRAFINLMLD